MPKIQGHNIVLFLMLLHPITCQHNTESKTYVTGDTIYVVW